MSRIICFDTLPNYGAAPPQGGAIAASFPFSQVSSPVPAINRIVNRFAARWRAARARRRSIDALFALSDRQLNDIGMNRANIISTASGADSFQYMADVK
jgi:uncharacterized protein YjiS (DUF1127 family)